MNKAHYAAVMQTYVGVRVSIGNCLVPLATYGVSSTCIKATLSHWVVFVVHWIKASDLLSRACNFLVYVTKQQAKAATGSR